LRYDVATIKPNKANSGWKLEPTLDGYMALGVSLYSLIEEAYGIYDDGLPGLICTNSNHRDWEQGAGYGKEKAHT
jgi:hypothetical protein